jgi:hypothetical protein
MRYRRIVLAALLAADPCAVFATKACMPSPCSPNGKFDAGSCAAAADWIATGRVEHVEHHPQGEPLFKDFADFDFAPRRWEKGEGPARVHCQVGWCENRMGPPDAADARVRIYGAKLPDDPALPARYLWIEALPASE